jgi:hypothetical protein
MQPVFTPKTTNFAVTYHAQEDNKLFVSPLTRKS